MLRQSHNNVRVHDRKEVPQPRMYAVNEYVLVLISDVHPMNILEPWKKKKKLSLSISPPSLSLHVLTFFLKSVPFHRLL